MERKMICQKCGKECVRINNAQRYCKACGTRKPSIIKRNCVVCGKEFEVPTTRNGAKRKYCSAECRRKVLNEKQKYARQHVCKFCGKLLPDGTTKYCSMDCEHKAINNGARKRGRPRKPLSIGEICILARAEGLTYGQYVSKYGGNG